MIQFFLVFFFLICFFHVVRFFFYLRVFSFFFSFFFACVFFPFLRKNSLHSGKFKVTRVTVGRDTDRPTKDFDLVK